MDAGSRSFYVKGKPIEKPSDLSGMKIRVMQNPMFVDMVNAMGGNGVQIAYNELYTSLQTGVVDGAENNPPSYDEGKHYEVAGYYTLDEHLMVPEIFVFSKKVWDTLVAGRPAAHPQGLRARRRQGARVVGGQGAEGARRSRAAGVTIITDVDKTPFIEATQAVRDKYGAQIRRPPEADQRGQIGTAHSRTAPARAVRRPSAPPSRGDAVVAGPRRRSSASPATPRTAHAIALRPRHGQALRAVHRHRGVSRSWR